LAGKHANPYLAETLKKWDGLKNRHREGRGNKAEKRRGRERNTEVKKPGEGGKREGQ